MKFGTLYPCFAVRCGMCKRDSLQTNGGTRAEAAELIRGLAWVRTRAWGWICPTCNEFGSSGVVPRCPVGASTTPDQSKEAPTASREENG